MEAGHGGETGTTSPCMPLLCILSSLNLYTSHFPTCIQVFYPQNKKIGVQHGGRKCPWRNGQRRRQRDGVCCPSAFSQNAHFSTTQPHKPIDVISPSAETPEQNMCAFPVCVRIPVFGPLVFGACKKMVYVRGCVRVCRCI